MRSKKVPQKVRTEKVNKALHNWTDFVKLLTGLNESEVQSALDKELAGEKRPSFISRLTARLAKLKGNSIKKAAGMPVSK